MSPCFFLGVGVSGQEFPEHLIFELKQILRQKNIHHVTAITTWNKKQNHPLIKALESEFEVPLLLFSVAQLEAQTPFLATPSRKLYERLGCHSVAEAASIAAAGEKAMLIIEKTICHRMSFAVAYSALKGVKM